MSRRTTAESIRKAEAMIRELIANDPLVCAVYDSAGNVEAALETLAQKADEAEAAWLEDEQQNWTEEDERLCASFYELTFRTVFSPRFVRADTARDLALRCLAKLNPSKLATLHHEARAKVLMCELRDWGQDAQVWALRADLCEQLRAAH